MVEQYGVLRGLLTVKDIMRFMHTLHESDANIGRASLTAASAETWDEYSGTLRTLLEESWEWASLWMGKTVDWVRDRTSMAMRLPNAGGARSFG